MPDLQRKQAAGKLTIDDILLSSLIAESPEHQIWIIEIFPDLSAHGAGGITLTDGNGHSHLHLIPELTDRLPNPIREIHSLL